MGNTHIKLLAAAFSVLSITQFFMVSNLAHQVNTYTDNVTASIVAAVPMRERVHLRRSLPLKRGDGAMVHFLRSREMHSAPSEKHPTCDARVIGPNGRVVTVCNTRGATETTDQK